MPHRFPFPALSPIADFVPVSETLATAGQPTTEQFALVRDAGFDTVINLATADSTGALPEEDIVVEELGMTYVSIPVRWLEPRRADLDRFFAEMDARKERERLFVHCAANKRVSAFLYLYSVLREDADEAAARAEMLNVWTPNERWQAFIEDTLGGTSEGA